MNDIDKLYQAIKEVQLEKKPLSLTEEEIEGQVDRQVNNNYLRELLYFFLEGCAFALKSSNDIVLEKKVAEQSELFYNLLSKETKEMIHTRNIMQVNASTDAFTFWKSSFRSEETAQTLWNIIKPDDELEELTDIQDSIDKSLKHLEGRVEAVELAILRMAELLKFQAPPEEKK